MASVIDSHPAKQQVIDGILAGRPMRELAALAGVSPMAVQRYAKSVVRPAIQWSRSIVAPQTIDKPRREPVPLSNDTAVTETAARAAGSLAPVIERLRKREARREALLSEAAEAKDFRGFASLDTCEHRDIELECRLAGLLDGAASNGSVTINQTVVLIPSMPDMPSQQAAAIDATSERVDDAR